MDDTQLPYFDEKVRVTFPDPDPDEEFGIVMVGGNLSPGMLISAYEQGVFPWFEPHQPILWWNPPFRCLLFPGELHMSKSMRRFMKRTNYRVTKNNSFSKVIRNCKEVPREGQQGTWITEDMVDAYTELHRLGFAHSYEVWDDDLLVGGLYGVEMRGYFCGESMFSYRSNASKLALVHLYREMIIEKGYAFIDFQVINPHSESLGAREIPRDEFLRMITKY